jgi:hypothetical protein
MVNVSTSSGVSEALILSCWSHEDTYQGIKLPHDPLIQRRHPFVEVHHSLKVQDGGWFLGPGKQGRKSPCPTINCPSSPLLAFMVGLDAVIKKESPCRAIAPGG